MNHPLLILLVHVFFTFCNTSICSSRTPGAYSLEQCSGGWSKFPQSSPPLSILSPHWQSSHIQNNPRAVIAIYQKQNKTKNVYLVGNSSPSEYSLERGRKTKTKKNWQSELLIFIKKKKSIGNYISFISPSASVWLLRLFGWRTIVAALLGVGSSTCLLDNYRLAWQWHYQYLGKLFPNYVRRDRNLVLHCVCR